jgi:protein TonB
MNLDQSESDDHFLWKAFVFSLCLHALLFRIKGYSFVHHENRMIEVDITNMGSADLSGERFSAATPGRPPRPASKPIPPPMAEPEPVQTKVIPRPAKESPSSAASEPSVPKSTEYAIGTGGGSSSSLTQIPKLLNWSDIDAILRRFYPEAAREDGREGTVVLDLHITVDGRVTAFEVVRSGGADFDAAAKKAATLLRFTPAFLGAERVGVKMRQVIQFKLGS